MFKSAKIKLTSWYLLVIMLITISFSALVYTNFMRVTTRALREHGARLELKINEFPRPQRPLGAFQEPLTAETIKDVRIKVITTLLLINTFILLIAGFLGYGLAGKTLKPIEQMTEKQKKFIADAAHEFKTPLTAMKTYLEVNLRNKTLTLEKAKGIMEESIKDIDALTLLSNSLLNQIKNQKENATLKFEAVSLKDIIQKSVSKLEQNALNKNINVKIEGKDINIKADLQSLLQLITILLDNAIKFNKDDGNINIDIKTTKKHAVIKVEDTGIGISAKDLPKIFDRFYKADDSRTKINHKGFGLGLAIAKEIVTNHRGDIAVKSTLGKGTVFTIKLPLNI